MQGAEDESEGSVLTYVTEPEFRKQRRRSPLCKVLIEEGQVTTSSYLPLTLLIEFCQIVSPQTSLSLLYHRRYSTPCQIHGSPIVRFLLVVSHLATQ